MPNNSIGNVDCSSYDPWSKLLKCVYEGFYRELLYRRLRGILGVRTMVHMGGSDLSTRA